jgi:hypothetical protein
MYDDVYEQMVVSGVAEKLSMPAYFDKNGNETTSSNAFGLPTHYKLIHSNYVVFVDECGSNTNQKDDGYCGGEMFVLPSESSDGGMKGSCTNLHFTVMCFMSGNGEEIMCAVILNYEKEAHKIPLSWKLGIDITNKLNDASTIVELLEKNSGEEGAMREGHFCKFNGINVPCFVGTSPKASITSQLLCKMLQFFKLMLTKNFNLMCKKKTEKSKTSETN